MAAAPSSSNVLKILTLNVCFELQQTYRRRFSALIQLIKVQSYDVVALQESVPTLYSMMINNSDMIKMYDISNPPSNAPYFTLLLCKKSHKAQFERYSIPSRMGRDVLIADIRRPRGGKLTCATVHLESEDNHAVREKQMQAVNEILENRTDVVLMGDFNFSSHRNYKVVPGERLHNDSIAECLPGYVDVWPALHPSNRGATFDHSKNQWKFDNVLRAKGWFRFDRVLARLSDRFRLTSIELAADKSIGIMEEDGERPECELYISDHQGLAFTLEETVNVSEEIVVEDIHEQESQGFASPSSSRVKRARQHEAPLIKSKTGEMSIYKDLLGDEPKANVPGSVRLAMVISSGRRITRWFMNASPVIALQWWAQSEDKALHAGGVEFELRRGDGGSISTSTDEEELERPLSSLQNLDNSLWRVIISRPQLGSPS